MTIYTTIFGNYEELKIPKKITPGWDYVCFTDQPIKSRVWKIIKETPDDPVLSARNRKINTPFDKSIWIDASLRITCDLNQFWDEHFVSPMTVVRHPWRTCVYKEIAACIANKRANEDDLLRQEKEYRKTVPENNGLIASGILLRENTQEVKEFCELWWEQIKLSTRDQIGFAYTEFTLNKYWPRIDLDYRSNKYFKFTTHYKRRK